MDNVTKRLDSELTAFPPGEVLWRTPDHNYTAGELLCFRAAYRKTHAALAREQVAVLCISNLHLALALLVLDGFAASILLLPSDQEDTSLLELYAHGNCTQLLADRTLGRIFHLPTSTLREAPDKKKFSEDQIPSLDTRWIIPTSGTTGTPKLVVHRLSDLTQKTKTNKSKGKMVRWGLLYSLQRFAGIQVYLQAFLGGSQLLLPDLNKPFEISLEFLKSASCNALSATPTLWRKCLMVPGFTQLPLKWITLGGETADQQILTALRHAFPDAKITHVYASTEAGVGFSVKDAREGFPADYLEHGCDGVELRVQPEGQLWIRKQNASQVYLGNEAIQNDEGWIDTGDLVERSPDQTRCLFLGRANGSINVGGSKVFPEKVEKLIRSVSGVQFVKVSRRRSPFMGQLVEAGILLENKATEADVKQAITEICETALERHERPAFIKILKQIDTTPTGKIRR